MVDRGQDDREIVNKFVLIEGQKDEFETLIFVSVVYTSIAFCSQFVILKWVGREGAA